MVSIGTWTSTLLWLLALQRVDYCMYFLRKICCMWVVVDHLLCEVSQYTEGQNTSFIDKISTYDEEGLSLFVYHDQMSIGGVKGGKRCRFYASDRDVNYETADGIAE